MGGLGGPHPDASHIKVLEMQVAVGDTALIGATEGLVVGIQAQGCVVKPHATLPSRPIQHHALHGKAGVAYTPEQPGYIGGRGRGPGALQEVGRGSRGPGDTQECSCGGGGPFPSTPLQDCGTPRAIDGRAQRGINQKGLCDNICTRGEEDRVVLVVL